jgi:hypothetical protein
MGMLVWANYGIRNNRIGGDYILKHRGKMILTDEIGNALPIDPVEVEYEQKVVNRNIRCFVDPRELTFEAPKKGFPKLDSPVWYELRTIIDDVPIIRDNTYHWLNPGETLTLNLNYDCPTCGKPMDLDQYEEYLINRSR